MSEEPAKYKCAECGETFNKVYSDREAMANAIDDYGVKMMYEADKLEVICDDCYNKIPNCPMCGTKSVLVDMDPGVAHGCPKCMVIIA